MESIDNVICLTIPMRDKFFKEIAEKLVSQKFKVESFPGIVATSLRLQSIHQLHPKLVSKEVKIIGKKISRLAIAMSHVLIWEKIKDSKEFHIILEDDVIIQPAIKSSIDKAVADCPFKWDILFLGYAGKLKGVTSGKYLLASPGNFPDTNHGMFAYIVNPKSVKKIINICKPIRKITHIDWILRGNYSINENKNKISAVYFVPNLIKHNNKIKSQNK